MSWTNSFITLGRTECKSPCLAVPLLFLFSVFIRCSGNVLIEPLPSNGLSLVYSLQLGEPLAGNGLLLRPHYSGFQALCHNIKFSSYLTGNTIPCGGGVEYLHRSPASRRRRRKRKSQSETVKYGRESHGTRTREWLRWRGPAAIVNDKPRPLVTESAPYQQTRNCLTVIKIWL
jgi:hypothetical protein